MGLLNRWKRRRGQQAPRRPAIFIPENHEPATYPGDGVRSCTVCGTTWKSFVGGLMDSGELAAYQARGDCEIFANWPDTLGLTCRNCRQSWCVDHLGQPATTTESVPRFSDYACTLCGEPLATC